MADAYLGEIRMWGIAYAPQGWALCDGSILNVQQNQALYSLIGTYFGGSAPTTFALPDMRGRTPIGVGASQTTPPVPLYQLGNKGGAETVALAANQTPPHAHSLIAATPPGTTVLPQGDLMASVAPATSGGPTVNVFLPSANWNADAQLAAGSVNSAGAGAAHANMQPFLVVGFTICVQGLYPPRP
jgi:microcystin-dependent protein